MLDEAVLIKKMYPLASTYRGHMPKFPGTDTAHHRSRTPGTRGSTTNTVYCDIAISTIVNSHHDNGWVWTMAVARSMGLNSFHDPEYVHIYGMIINICQEDMAVWMSAVVEANWKPGFAYARESE